MIVKHHLSACEGFCPPLNVHSALVSWDQPWQEGHMFLQVVRRGEVRFYKLCRVGKGRINNHSQSPGWDFNSIRVRVLGMDAEL